MVEHALLLSHEIDWINAKVIDFASGVSQRRIKEKWHIASSLARETANEQGQRTKPGESVAKQPVISVNPIQARLFFLSSCGQGGHILPPFENHVPLVPTAYY